jgi:hypothetical protein
MSTARTPEQLAAANYRLAAHRAKKRGQAVPDRETHIAAYLAAHGKAQPAAPDANAVPAGSQHAPAQSGLLGHNQGVAPVTPDGEARNAATPATPSKTAVMAEERGGAALVVSGARGRRSPERAADGSSLPIASQAVFEDAARRFASGEPWEDVSKALTVSWGEVVRRGRMEGNVDTWTEAQAEHKRRILSHVGENAARCAFGGVKTKTVRKIENGKPVEEIVTEERAADPALARIAMEYAAPEIHGRQASRGPGVTVNAYNAAIFGGPPAPESLDSFDARGLPPQSTPPAA